MNSRQPRSAPKTPARRKVGRDFFAVLVVGAVIGTALAMNVIDRFRPAGLLGHLSASLQAISPSLHLAAGDEQDPFPVSAISNVPSAAEAGSKRKPYSDHFPVCSMNVATRANCVIDGDTFYWRGTTIRIADIDAPETHPPRCAYEADLGDRATNRLAGLLSAGPFRLVREGRDLDKYGRQLRVVMRDGKSIGSMLVREGLARPWTGKRRPWCGSRDSFG